MKPRVTQAPGPRSMVVRVASNDRSAHGRRASALAARRAVGDSPETNNRITTHTEYDESTGEWVSTVTYRSPRVIDIAARAVANGLPDDR